MEVTADLLVALDRPVPRYTSYPTAPQFQGVSQELLLEKLTLFDQSDKPLSIYIHIPFCKTMCLFCGCSVVLNRNPQKQTDYLQSLLGEITLTASQFAKRRKVAQLHLGGGTPTSLTEKEFEHLLAHLYRHFEILKDAEISIEVDPRTVHEDHGQKLSCLKKLGFNRVSFGVQDLDPKVQEAVKRRQSEEVTVATYWKARELGFQGINIDLIYGLPLQTVDSFIQTVDRLIQLRPDRLVFYSYAKVPWLKPHQKAIPDHLLPPTNEKFQIYVEARKRFIEGGYVPIGMDHFSLPEDPLAESYFNKTLTRNFQGYSIQLAADMLGFGITAMGFLEGCFFQNSKEISDYASRIERGVLPVFRGFILSEEDHRRRFVILSLMCHFELDKREFKKLFGLDFDVHFSFAKQSLNELNAQGLLRETPDHLIPTTLGKLFIRIIASVFDAYLKEGQFSKAV